MRRILILCALLVASGCAQSSFAPTPVDEKITGTWIGDFTSSNNESVPIRVNLYESASTVSGSWKSSAVYEWSGGFVGSRSGSSLSAKLTFTGRTEENTLCVGTANVSGSIDGGSLSLTSADGVTGPPCSAPLPVDIEIDLHR